MTDRAYDAKVIDLGDNIQRLEIIWDGGVIAASEIEGLDPLLETAAAVLWKFQRPGSDKEEIGESVVPVLRKADD